MTTQFCVSAIQMTAQGCFATGATMKRKPLLFLCLWLCGIAPLSAAPAPVIRVVPTENPRDGFGTLKQLDPKLVLDDDRLTSNLWTSDTRLGFALTTGNTRALAVSSLHKSTWRIRRFEQAWRLGANYQETFATTDGTTTGTTARHVYGTYRLDYYFTPRTTVYVGGGGYTDAVKGIALAGQGFAGFARYLVKRPAWYLRGAVGYDFTSENRDDTSVEQIHSATAGLTYLHALSDSVRWNASLLAQQNIRHSRDLRVVADAELRCAIAKHVDVSIGINARYDREPVPGFRSLDTLTDVGVVLRF